jgi:hypothetical protein
LVGARWNVRASCSAVIQAPLVARAARTAWTCSASGFGQGCFLTGPAGVDLGLGSASASVAIGSAVWTALAPSGFWNSGQSHRTTLRDSSAALRIQVHQPSQDLVIAQIARPAVGVVYRRVQVIVDLFEYRDETNFLDGLPFLRQGFARAELGHNIMLTRKGTLGVFGLSGFL